MINIALCDDEECFVSELKNLLYRYAKETETKIRVTVFRDGMELTEHYDLNFDLIFLDIQMEKMDGLETAGRVRQMDGKVGIIFLTTHMKYGLQGYQYQAVDYIVKPIGYARLKAEMDQWIERQLREESPSIAIANETGNYRIILKTLRYVETFSRCLLFHTENENITCRSSMKEMEARLQQDGFVRCHTSYIVNLNYVKGVKKLEIELITGELLPLSQPKRKEFMKALATYWGDYL